ncbi:MAG: J domain-containing protein [Lachnospiraceae bacterium]|nr:J domain-containing protein [Lachnospiraceae bacterium]
MFISEAFKILEIEATEDRNIIRKAYAALVRRYHPEEYPEEWQRIHEAYEVVLQYAASGVQPTERYVEINEQDHEQESLKYSTELMGEVSEDDEITEVGEDAGEDEEWKEWNDTKAFFQERQKVRKEDSQLAKGKVYAFFHENSRKKLKKNREWKKFLQSSALLSIRTEEWVLEEFLNMVRVEKFSTQIFNLLENYLKETRQEIENTPYTEEKQQRLFLLRETEKVITANREQREERKRKATHVLIMVLIVLKAVVRACG